MSQSIQNPIGINVFGSAVLRVAPDCAAIDLSVKTPQQQPNAAFEETRKKANSVRQFLARERIDDVQSSHIGLSHDWGYVDGHRKPQGYMATISFNIVLNDLDRVEQIVCGAIEAGANRIERVSFKTRQLKEYRAKARQKAVAAARQKAELYTTAAGVSLGKILHIEDVNPLQFRGSESHVESELAIDEDSPVSAFDPGAIAVRAAVILTYEIDAT